MHITLMRDADPASVLESIRAITPFMNEVHAEDGQIVLDLGEAGLDPRWFDDLVAIEGVDTAVMAGGERVFRCPMGRGD